MAVNTIIPVRNSFVKNFTRRFSMKESVTLQVNYEGQLHQVNADTLLVSLLCFTEAIKKISKKITEEEIQIKIRSTEKGSFVVVLEIVKKTIFDLFSNPEIALDTIHKIIGTTIDFLTIKKFLKGKKPDEIITENEKVIIIKNNNNIIVEKIIFDVYQQDRDINLYIERMFHVVSEDPEIEDISIISDTNESFCANRNDFYEMCQENDFLQKDKIKEIKENATLTIIKLVFQRNRKWEFVFNGNRISVFIEDKQFWQHIDSGKLQFSRGDSLIANLEITKIFDPELNCYINNTYKIIKVISHKPGNSYRQNELTL